MSLYELRRQVCEANQLLPKFGLITLTWGNVSAYDPERKQMVIKPSGVPYEQLTPENMVVVNLDGTMEKGGLNPSSDTPTHLELYRVFPGIRSIVHTHSTWATIWAQLGKDIPPFGTTHADDFLGAIPCTRGLTMEEIAANYEENTGKVIVETVGCGNVDRIFAALVKCHGPFVWSDTPVHAVEKALVLEQVAMMAWHTAFAEGNMSPMPEALMNKHFDRKHGTSAYYGQRENRGTR